MTVNTNYKNVINKILGAIKMKQIFLVMIGFSILIYADFSRDNGVVIDNKTELVWQDDYSDNAGSIKSATWQEAINYCKALSLDGNVDWKLPNKNELLSIINYSKHTPALDSAFQYIDSDKYKYWTSTTSTKDTENAFFINMNTGHAGIVDSNNDKSSTNYVRCVRGGQ